jgi:hypothetical protein
MEVSWAISNLFRKKPKVYKEGEDYHFIDFKDSDITGIELLMDGYKGILYHYHSARVVEEGELARLQFGYTIVHPGEHDIDVLNSDEKFHIIMGDILTILLESKIKDEQIGTNNSEKFDLQ